MTQQNSSAGALDQFGDAAGYGMLPDALRPAASRVGFWPRLGAALIDAAIMIPFVIAYSTSIAYLHQRGRLTATMEYLIVVTSGLFALMYTSTEVFFAGTPGKMVLKQRIANADGTPAGGWVLFNRWFYKNGGYVIAFLSEVAMVPTLDYLGAIWRFMIVIGCFFVFQTSRQAFHDRWAHTAVYPKRAVAQRGFEPLPVQPMAAGAPAPPL